MPIPPPRISKHSKEIEVLNSLIMDLRMQLLGEQPLKPIDKERLNEATTALGKLHECYDEMRIRY